MSWMRNFLNRLINPKSDLSGLPSVVPLEIETKIASRRKKAARKAILTNFPLLLGSSVVLILFFIVLYGPTIAPQNPYLSGRPIEPYYDPELEQFIQPPLPPSSEFPLGTDRWGIDILSLLLHGARNTLVACAFITMARVLLGVILGGIAGWNESRLVDQIIMGSMGVITALPLLISSMIVIYALDIRRGLPVFIVALSIVGWTEIAQYIRSEFLILKKMPYIEGADSVGIPALGTAVRHILPNVLPHLLIITFMEMGAVMMLLGELGFIGVYIGGGSRISIEVAIEVNQVFQLVEVPEWGAMLAEGFRYLRSKPFVVFPPALAFSVAVIGFNTLGEGLRRHTATYGLNTAVLLRKRMLLIVIGLSVATIYIIQRTGPTPWFTKVALAFNGQRAYNEAQVLASFSGRGHGQPGGQQTIDHLVERFQEAGLDPGWKQNSYIYSVNARIVRPRSQPELSLLSDEGMNQEVFLHQTDFGFVIEGHGGAGYAEGELTFLGFRSDRELNPEAYKGLDLTDRIVVLQEGNAPWSFATEALIRGATGIIWITPESGDTLRSQMLAFEENGDALRSPSIPIFRIKPEIAQRILVQEGLSIPDLYELDLAMESGEGWFRRDLEIQVRMRLELSEPEPYPVQHVLGFRPGSDFDYAGELIILFANYDGLGIDPDGTQYPGANHNASGVAVLLELAQLWDDQSLDPRRPVLFVAWGSGTQNFAGASQFLEDPLNYRHLISANPTVRVAPAVVFFIEDVGVGEEVLQVQESRAARYLDLLRETTSEREISIVVPEINTSIEALDPSTRIPWLQLQWVQQGLNPQDDVADMLDLDRLQEFGEVFALMMAKIVRQSNY